MTAKKNTGKSYELLIGNIFKEIWDQNLAKTIEIKRNVILKGKVGNHEVDIYWEFIIGGITYKTIIQAKDWSYPVKKGALMEFSKVLEDISGQPRGIFITKTGYQKGALNWANAHGILLYTLTPAEYKPLMLKTLGYAKGKVIPVRLLGVGPGIGSIFEFTIFDPVITGPILNLDSEWIIKNAPKYKDKITEHVLTALKALKYNEIEFYVGHPFITSCPSARCPTMSASRRWHPDVPIRFGLRFSSAMHI